MFKLYLEKAEEPDIMFKLYLEKTEEPDIKLPTSIQSQKKQENSRKTSASASLTTLKPLTVWITANCGKFFKMGIPDKFTCLLTNLYESKKATEFQKNIYFYFIDYAKAFRCLDHNKLWKILKEMGIPDHLTCLLRNLYAGQEATVRTLHGTKDWFKIGN